MTTHLVTFSDESMSRSRDLCVRSAIVKGGIGSNEIHSYNQWDIEQLRNEHLQLFVNGKGFGYWCWKPYLIDLLTGLGGFVRGISENDVICYADAGVEFINPVSHIVDRMDQDIFLFGNNWEHAHWCKRDVIDAVWPDPPTDYTSEERHSALIRLQSRAESGDKGAMLTLEVMDKILTGDSAIAHDVQWLKYGKQVQASIIFFRVSDYTRAFVKEWLDWCLFEGGRLIDDSPSRLPNHPEFQEHRHDQAILTTMAYRDGLRLHWWPAIYNDGQFTYEKLPEYMGDTYDPIFHHHRKRNYEWSNFADGLDQTRQRWAELGVIVD